MPPKQKGRRCPSIWFSVSSFSTGGVGPSGFKRQASSWSDGERILEPIAEPVGNAGTAFIAQIGIWIVGVPSSEPPRHRHGHKLT